MSEPTRPMEPQPPAALRRSITLIPLALYGVGVTVGAGIYVLVGEAARVAGAAAPLSFILAALVVAPTAFSFGELSSRLPRSAGEAVYVGEAFRSVNLARLIGLFVAAVGIVSAAAVAIGAAGYLREFVAVPRAATAFALIVVLGAVAAWGVVQSMAVAVAISLFEVGALIWIVIVGAPAVSDPLAHIVAIWPQGGAVQWVGVGSAMLFAVFAFVGFEDIVNMAEEVKAPERTMPRAIALTLFMTTGLYLSVIFVAVAVVAPAELAGQEAPLARVYAVATGRDPAPISAIAVGATLNTVLIQMLMASRVLYGLAREKALPAWLGTVSPVTRTPLPATFLVVAIVALLAVLLPIGDLARATSAVILLIFTIVNLALIRIKLRADVPPPFAVPLWVPVAGAALSSLVFLFEAARLLV
ncbi:MAG: APC family permease [Hyphomicrobiales bacterium]|nr:APC family permease [Hyphomicrobiales bacterium]